jgi:myo-inositol-1-phosphate synthase
MKQKARCGKAHWSPTGAGVDCNDWKCMTEKRRIGIWLIGSKGGVATTAIVGLIALKKGLAAATGLVTALPEFAALDLAAIDPGTGDEFVIGGHEIRGLRLCREAYRVATEMRASSREVIDQCREDLEGIEARIRPGTIWNSGPTIEALADLDLPREKTPRQTVERLKSDLRQFMAAEKVDRLVVVNVASTEPPSSWSSAFRRLDETPAEAGTPTDMPVKAGTPAPSTWAALEPLLDRADCPLPASSLYAIAAFEVGASYINFTPSLGAAPPAIDELARLRGCCHAGCDGKTGETLLKSVLAPMFAARNLRIMSWVGHNIFGNLDGRVLDDPANKQAKLQSKDRLLGEVLGYKPQTLTSIEFIESLGDWKTAWDHIHFAGFLGAPMTLQFIWQGCDSVLAAPLVIDLVRLTELAARSGQKGLLKFLASFFKSPMGVEEHSFVLQFQMLQQWLEEARDTAPSTTQRHEAKHA